MNNLDSSARSQRSTVKVPKQDTDDSLTIVKPKYIRKNERKHSRSSKRKSAVHFVPIKDNTSKKNEKSQSPMKAYDKIARMQHSVTTTANKAPIKQIDTEGIAALVSSATKPVVELIDRMSERYTNLTQNYGNMTDKFGVIMDKVLNSHLEEKVLVNDLEKLRVEVQAKVEISRAEANSRVEMNREILLQTEIKSRQEEIYSQRAADQSNLDRKADELAATREHELRVLELKLKFESKKVRKINNVYYVLY